MKTFALAVTVAAGLVLTAGSADAQFRYRSSNSYSTYRSGSIYSYPSYSYPSTYYATPVYSSGIVTSSYLPSYSSVIVPASGYTPFYPAPTYSYTYPTYGSTYVAPAGGFYRTRGWRW
ncbi:MAG TPA: hypothetical protein VGE74_31855 [Gemmata sp.]